MADDIVQTIKIQVEGGDEAAAALKEVGESATSSFEETQKAADTAGVSIEDFGKLSEKTQAAYIELSQRVTEGSESIVASTKEVQQAAASGGQGARELGGGLDEVSEKSGVSSREMRGLGKIMKELGAGEAAGLAVSFSKVASSLGVLGAAALAVAMATGALVRFGKEAAEAAKGMDDLAKVSGTSAESMKLLEGVFNSLGVSSKKFQQEMTGLLVTVLEKAPKLGDEVAKSAEAAIKAQAALEKAQTEEKGQFKTRQLEQQSQQLVFQTQQLERQGEQLDRNLASVQQQLATIDRMQALERQRADLSVRDAESSLKMLKLKRDLLLNRITESQFDKAVAQEEGRSFLRSIEKAELDVRNARQEKAALKEKQEQQKSALEFQVQQIKLAQEQLPLQREQIELQREQNELARKQLEALKGLDVAEAQRKANEALANSLAAVAAALADASGGFDSLAGSVKTLIGSGAPLSTLLTDVIGALAKAGMSSEDIAKGFNAAGVDVDKFLPLLARMYDGLTGLQKLRLDQVMRALKVPEEAIASIRKGSDEFAKLREKSGELQWARNLLDEFGRALDFTGTKAGNFGIRLGGLGVILLKVFGAIEHIIIDPFIRGFSKLPEIVDEQMKMLATAIAKTPLPGAFQWIADTFNAAVSWVVTKANEVKVFIDTWVVTPVDGAWGWLKSTFNSAVGWILTKAGEVTAFINAWVVTPAANAWQWIVDTFNSALASVQSAASAATAAITTWVTTPVANAWQWIVDKWNAMLQALGFGGGGAAAPAGGGIPGQAGGGLLGGRGTGTSDSNLAWVSRGEHIMPARAVSRPGVLAFLEALRLSGGNLRAVLDGMGRFALGGLVAPTLSLPAFAGGGMNHVTIQFPGLPEITGLRASSAVVDELRKAAAMSQVRSGGRKPSRYS
jgi:hypothetical protein